MQSMMEKEARDAPHAVQRFLDANRNSLTEIGRYLRKHEPPLIMTNARGSSDNAAGYFKYLEEIIMGVPCASVGASVVSIYGARLKVAKGLCLTISQSGKSPDIVHMQAEARRAGALAVAMVNDENSEAARGADILLPLAAGPEKSVAATKTVITSMIGAAAITAAWRDDDAFLNAIDRSAEYLDQASHMTWDAVQENLRDIASLYVLGRGPSLPIAEEMSLKLKETCAIHAEAYSSAEVMHGPLELLGKGFDVIALVPNDAARESNLAAITKMRKSGAQVMVIDNAELPFVPMQPTLLEPISILQSAFINIEAIARARGRDPDRPKLLSKVTETV
jgi:glutamine---fructose-6-phosphate transaminase (isomerizing)